MVITVQGAERDIRGVSGKMNVHCQELSSVAAWKYVSGIMANTRLAWRKVHALIQPPLLIWQHKRGCYRRLPKSSFFFLFPPVYMKGWTVGGHEKHLKDPPRGTLEFLGNSFRAGKDGKGHGFPGTSKGGHRK